MIKNLQFTNSKQISKIRRDVGGVRPVFIAYKVLIYSTSQKRDISNYSEEKFKKFLEKNDYTFLGNEVALPEVSTPVF